MAADLKINVKEQNWTVAAAEPVNESHLIYP
jgi:hypothetical protein